MFQISLKNNKTFTCDSNTTIFEVAKSAGVFLDKLLTECDEFNTYNWKIIYEHMYKPASVFDARTILEVAMMQKMGFQFKGIRKG